MTVDVNLRVRQQQGAGRVGDSGIDDPTIEISPVGPVRPVAAEEAPARPPSPELEAAAAFDATESMDLSGLRPEVGPLSPGAGVSGRGAERATGRIDPRFAARWTQVRREAGRRRLRVLVAAVAVLGLLLAGVGSLYTPLFAVTKVDVSGSGPIPVGRVLAIAGLSGHPLLIDVNSGRAEARLDAIPQLGGAVVRREWPSTVRVRVVYRPAVAIVAAVAGAGATSAWAGVDATGRVLSIAPAPPPGLPVIQGSGPAPGVGQWLAGAAGPRVRPPAPGGPPIADLNAAVDSPSVPTGAAAALAVAAAIPASLRGEVQTITFGAGAATFAGAVGGTLSVTVLPATMAAGSIPVDLGDGSQLATKLTALVTLLGEADLSGATGIDISVPNRPAVLTARQGPGTVSTQPGG